METDDDFTTNVPFVLCSVEVGWMVGWFIASYQAKMLKTNSLGIHMYIYAFNGQKS